MAEASPEPLYDLIRRIRHPASFRDLIASCLRSVYTGDPFSEKDGLLKIPDYLIEEVIVSEQVIAGVRCVFYAPKNAKENLPLLLYMHGGGFVIGCSEDTDYITRMLCHSNQMLVVSVNYRLAPEAVFPAQLDDCKNVLNAILDSESEYKLDTNSLYLAGDSAGGNLALVLSTQVPHHVCGNILLAPWLDMNFEEYSSYDRLAATNVALDSAFLSFARAVYTSHDQWNNPLVSPLNLSPTDLPPTIVLVGTEDPLLDQAAKFQEKASLKIRAVIYEGMPHCFYSFPNLFKEERDCYEYIAEFIRQTIQR